MINARVFGPGILTICLQKIYIYTYTNESDATARYSPIISFADVETTKLRDDRREIQIVPSICDAHATRRLVIRCLFSVFSSNRRDLFFRCLREISVNDDGNETS